MPRLIIFDCDGVLVDSEAVMVAAELEFLAGLGVRLERAAYIRQFMGKPIEAWTAEVEAACAQATGRPPPAGAFDELDRTVRARLRAELAAVEGVHEALATLDGRGTGADRLARCVASSSKSSSIEWKLRATGLLDAFAPHLFSAEMVARGKPEPDLFLHAAERMGVAPADCVVVEDSSNGVVAAKRAGMRAVGLTAGAHCPPGHGEALRADGADVVVAAFSELAAVLLDAP